MCKPGNIQELSAGFDTLFALGFAAGGVMWVNEPHMLQRGVAELFGFRITLLSAAFSVGFAILWRECFARLGVYGREVIGFSRLMIRTAVGSAIMTALLTVYLYNAQSVRPVGKFAVQLLIFAFGYQVCRLLVSRPQFWQYATGPERVVILGSGPRAGRAWRELRTRYRQSKSLLGFVDDRDPAAMPPDIATRFIGDVNSLSDYLLRNAVDELIVATPRSSYEMTQRGITIAESAGVRLVVLNDVYTLKHQKNLRERATMFVELVPQDSSRETAEVAKRALDMLASAGGLVLLAPLLLVIGLAIKLTSPGSVFFVQERYGYRRRQFKMYKFRSMVRNAPARMPDPEPRDEAHDPISKITNDPRITPVGRFLRRTSLDELPQLWNVLLGDMSLVGPPPMSVHDVSLFSEAQLMRRFSVRPGITGIRQVSGGSLFSFDKWLQLDFSYIDQWSFVLDLKILARTVPFLLKRPGAF
jgi:exopolysaccharide biosynthesis polyprenyl glycosylphosphotransferase